MPLNNFKIKYNLKSRAVDEIKNKKDDIKSQNMSENNPETIYAPDFNRYPRWPYENPNDYQSDQPNQPSNQQPNFQPATPNQQPNFQPATPNQQPNFQPAMPNQQPNFQPAMPNQQPSFQPIEAPIRNPYVPVGRERMSSGYIETTLERDLELMRTLYSRINQELYPIVVEILNQYEYDGSPIYEKEIDRESIAQLTDRVLRRASEVSDDAQEALLDERNFMIEDRIFEWNRENLLKSAVELILLNEIFSIRRPNYRKVRNRYRYSDGLYSGINYY